MKRNGFRIALFVFFPSCFFAWRRISDKIAVLSTGCLDDKFPGGIDEHFEKQVFPNHISGSFRDWSGTGVMAGNFQTISGTGFSFRPVFFRNYGFPGVWDHSRFGQCACIHLCVLFIPVYPSHIQKPEGVRGKEQGRIHEIPGIPTDASRGKRLSDSCGWFPCFVSGSYSFRHAALNRMSLRFAQCI